MTEVTGNSGELPDAVGSELSGGLGAFYDEPNADEPCMICQFSNYDSFHGEKWCGHKPPPEGLPPRLLIDRWGHCSYWMPMRPTSAITGTTAQRLGPS